jgi:hypothetical protein
MMTSATEKRQTKNEHQDRILLVLQEGGGDMGGCQFRELEIPMGVPSLELILA